MIDNLDYNLDLCVFQRVVRPDAPRAEGEGGVGQMTDKAGLLTSGTYCRRLTSLQPPAYMLTLATGLSRPPVARSSSLLTNMHKCIPCCSKLVSKKILSYGLHWNELNCTKNVTQTIMWLCGHYTNEMGPLMGVHLSLIHI